MNKGKVTFVWVVFGLVVAGAGLGAGLAARFAMPKVSSSLPPVETPVDTNVTSSPNDLPPLSPVSAGAVSQSFCQGSPLEPVTNSLYQVRTINAIANDPLPVIANLSGLVTPDRLASFNPAPFPNISERAKNARIPIIMYHDITPTKDVDWDVTVEDFERHLQTLQTGGYTPISMDQMVSHLRTGAPLPEKPVLLTFDDNYVGQYKYAFPLLQKYNYPAVWSVHTKFVGTGGKKPKATWDNLREMQKSGLITIASHTVNHINFRELDDAKIAKELKESKAVLEKELGITIEYFTYPEGDYTERSKQLVQDAGYKAALTMSLDPRQERTANESEDLLGIMRYGQSRFNDVIEQASAGTTSESLALLPAMRQSEINFTTPVEKRSVTVDGLKLTLVYGGRPVTAHADKRAAVEDIKQKMVPDAIAAVDGGFFSLERIDGNKMIGPVLSQNSSQAGKFDVGNKGENPLLNGRPLVLISPTAVKFVPFDAKKHVSLESVQAELPDTTDAFVAAGWLVRDGKPQPAEAFGRLYGFDASRDRAFWGIDRSGRPVIGVTMEMIDSVGLGKILAKAGLSDVVMLDSGASAALAYRGKSVMKYEPRPVPHIVALLPPNPVAPKAEPEKDVCKLSVSVYPK
jgi:poly-beta-1,6-N-acetyl-D-glucosamine N-deacetylase